MKRDKYKSSIADKRRSGRKKLHKTYLIVCEGTQTESLYFKDIGKDIASVLHVSKDFITVDGTGMSTLSLLEHARLKRKKDWKKNPYTNVWIVFDRDDFPKDDFDNTIHSCNDNKANDIKAAYSNPNFELWYLLHFEDLNSSIERDETEHRLKNKHVKGYHKSKPGMYALLKEKQSIAIERAKKLMTRHGKIPYHKANPLTNVHQLVQELNCLKQI